MTWPKAGRTSHHAPGSAPARCASWRPTPSPAWRTAATSLLAARLLAPPEPQALTVFGAGVQARAHIEAFSHHWPLADVRTVRLGDPAAGLEGADLVVLATRATEPLFGGVRQICR